MKLLQSGWICAVLGSLSFFGVVGALLQPGRIGPITAGARETKAHEGLKPSWEFVNPELDQLVKELKTEKEALENRARQLDELNTRLETERAEIAVLTGALNKMRKESEAKSMKIREEEAANLKKLAKTYAAMTPEGAAVIFKQMEDEQIAKMLVYMKDDEKAPILENFARLGEPEAKRVALLSALIPKATKPEVKP